MKNAFERKEQFEKGKLVRREWSIGPIVPWSITAWIIVWSGYVDKIPATFWGLFPK